MYLSALGAMHPSRGHSKSKYESISRNPSASANSYIVGSCQELSTNRSTTPWYPFPIHVSASPKSADARSPTCYTIGQFCPPYTVDPFDGNFGWIYPTVSRWLHWSYPISCCTYVQFVISLPCLIFASVFTTYKHPLAPRGCPHECSGRSIRYCLR